MTVLTQDAIWRAIVDALGRLMAEQEQELGDVTPATWLCKDLGVSSIDIIHLMVTLEDQLNMPLDFGELAAGADGQLRSDIELGELQTFITERAGTQAISPSER